MLRYIGKTPDLKESFTEFSVMLEKSFKYYLEHQDEFVEKYNGKVIVLKGTELVEVFDSVPEAYWYASENDLLGQVLIHEVGPGKENYTLRISSYLVFA